MPWPELRLVQSRRVTPSSLRCQWLNGKNDLCIIISAGHSTIMTVRPALDEWLEGRYGDITITCRLTQIMTGHGGSIRFLCHKGRQETPGCLTMMCCTHWQNAQLGRRNVVSLLWRSEWLSPNCFLW